MKYALPLVVVLASGVLVFAQEQEREVPRDSSRITIPGCVKGRTFVIAAREGHESSSRELMPGRRFRLSGPRDVLREIEKREGQMVQVTGLVRKADLAGPGGLTAAGGRVRIGGGAPQAQVGGGASRSPITGATPDAVLDVEGWNVLPESCPAR